jgi:hypothetical protein
MQKEFMSNEEFERCKNQIIQPEVDQKVFQLVKSKFRTGTSVDIHQSTKYRLLSLLIIDVGFKIKLN